MGDGYSSIGLIKSSIQSKATTTTAKTVVKAEALPHPPLLSNSSLPVVVAETGDSHSLRKCSIAERVTYVQDSCRRAAGASDTRAKRQAQVAAHRNIVVDKKHKILLCVPYKSGASTHLNLLAQNSDAVLKNTIPAEQLHKILNSLSSPQSRKRVGLQDFTAFSTKDRQRLMNEYFKVTVVRHPFVRLLSMYLNKVGRFNNSTMMWDCSDNYYGTDLQEWIRIKHPHRSSNCSLDLFIDYLLNHKSKMSRDMHTAPMHSWCGPCDVTYDYIVRLETGDTDQQYLLQNKINPNFNRTLHENPALHKNVNGESFESRWPQFRDVSDDQLRGLREMYAPDLDLFGYEYERNGHETSLKTKCHINTSGASPCC